MRSLLLAPWLLAATPAVALDEQVPTTRTVAVALWVADLDRVDSVRQTSSANVVISLRWRDRELADPAAGRRAVDLSKEPS